MRTLKILLAYDGSRYVGWQRQPNGTSVQALLEGALVPLNRGLPVRVAGAGRTDAGVHALGQVASCRLESDLDPADLTRALNARLPADVRVLDVTDAPDAFHARFWARSKTYAYAVLNTPVADPVARGVVWHVPQRLDVAAMRTALAAVRGQHDFKAFQAAGTRVTDTVRTLTAASLDSRVWTGLLDLTTTPWPSGATAGGTAGDAVLLVFHLTGDGFLRHMVRNLVGTMVEVGLGRRPVDAIGSLLAGRDRRRAGATAPPQGLVLVGVEHGDGPRHLPLSPNPR